MHFDNLLFFAGLAQAGVVVFSLLAIATGVLLFCVMDSTHETLRGCAILLLVAFAFAAFAGVCHAVDTAIEKPKQTICDAPPALEKGP